MMVMMCRLGYMLLQLLLELVKHLSKKLIGVCECSKNSLSSQSSHSSQNEERKGRRYRLVDKELNKWEEIKEEEGGK